MLTNTGTNEEMIALQGRHYPCPGGPHNFALIVEARVWGSQDLLVFVGRASCTLSQDPPGAQKQVWKSLDLGDGPAAGENSREPGESRTKMGPPREACLHSATK
jgi:hypothetical protein